ncbi:glycoside hydrolase family 104 protein [Pelomonas sp. PFR6]|uniref:Glycoside hydrolase family 104 protein n=2 Tax=Roseateles violae TaxID=3058042 RepID=A0ABT8E0D2_9BURK|nr:glycoside hydrolase family 104 protein [Pelomonas sp. PFR6]MDN3923317.1 glycoside hydrolase family 104 protein [Pelomonas sp. PFR6]
MADQNTAAFLLMIRTAEGTAGPNGYRTLFGGQLFSGWADHPRIAKQFRDGAGRTLWTTAAGAYQAMAISPIPGGFTSSNTWDRIAARLGLPDFTPASQDAFAVELIREAGALADVRAGRFDAAVSKVRRIWASMPGAGYAQPEKNLESLRLAYLNAGGSLA